MQASVAGVPCKFCKPCSHQGGQSGNLLNSTANTPLLSQTQVPPQIALQPSLLQKKEPLPSAVDIKKGGSMSTFQLQSILPNYISSGNQPANSVSPLVNYVSGAALLPVRSHPLQIPVLVALDKKLPFMENCSVKTPHTLGSKFRIVEANFESSLNG